MPREPRLTPKTRSHQQTCIPQAPDELLDVLIRRRFPVLATDHDPARARHWEGHISVDDRGCGMRPKDRAEREPDTEELGARRYRRSRRPGLRPAEAGEQPTPPPREYQLAARPSG